MLNDRLLHFVNIDLHEVKVFFPSIICFFYDTLNYLDV